MSADASLIDQSALFLSKDRFKDIVAKILFLQHKQLSESDIELVKDKALNLLLNNRTQVGTSQANGWVIPYPLKVMLLASCCAGLSFFALYQMALYWKRKQRAALEHRIAQVKEMTRLLRSLDSELTAGTGSARSRWLAERKYLHDQLKAVIQACQQRLQEKESLFTTCLVSLKASIDNSGMDVAFSKYIGMHSSKNYSVTNEIRALKGLLLKI